MALLSEVMDALGEIFPWELAKNDDGSGLLVGSPDSEVHHVICSIELTGDIVEAAVDSGCELLVTHHPQLFRHQATWDLTTPAGSIAKRAVLGGLNIVACHTNADAADGGAADLMAERLRLDAREPLERSESVYMAKVVVFVPPEALEEVQAAMAAAGAGIIGDYTHCGFRSSGKGTFLPGVGTRPYSGEVGNMSIEDEVRLEMPVPSFKVPAVVAGMFGKHPYEEVAYDVYRTENPVPWGIGRLGALPERRTLLDIMEDLTGWCGSRDPRLFGETGQNVTRVAVVPGEANNLVIPAYLAGAELLVAGSVDRHKTVEARQAGMDLLCLGHVESERALVGRMVEGLTEESKRRGLGLAVEGYMDHEGRRG